MKNWIRKIYRRLISDKITEAECLVKLFYNLYCLDIKVPLFPDGYSGNASFLYTILKLVHLGRPKLILELGSGQSTLLLNKLQGIKNHTFQISSVEHSKNWYEILAPQLNKGNHNYHLAPLIEGHEFKNKYYDLPADILQNYKYDFIIIDGPPRGMAFRSDILYYIKEYDLLASDFILLIDDTEKETEKKTCQEFQNYFKEKSINYSCSTILGRKHQKLYVTGKYSFLVNV